MDIIDAGMQQIPEDGCYVNYSNFGSVTTNNIDNDEDMLIERTCSVLGCEEYKNVEDELFYKFPEDETRQIWINLTGRTNWHPQEDSYICVVHFSVDSFKCNSNNDMVLVNGAIPSMRLPNHVLEAEYIEESDSEMESNFCENIQVNGELNHMTKPLVHNLRKPEETVKLLKLFSEIQKMQIKAVDLKEKVKYNKKLFLRQNKYLQRLKEIIATKEVLLKRKKKKIYINLPLLDKLGEDSDDYIASMPSKYTDDLKNFALSIYKYSPQSYVFIRNTLRTMLPSGKILDGWIKAGFQPRNVMSNKNLIKIVSEQTESELTCKICIH